MIETFILDWKFLSTEEMQDRIDWLRASLEAGEDWGFCRENKVCVLKTSTANTLYRLRWFDKNTEIDTSNVKYDNDYNIEDINHVWK
jgi:hypothetical protein